MSDAPRVSKDAYWHGQLRRIVGLLAVWAVTAFVLSIWLAPTLNAVSLGGVPLGFWMAQQGSIFVFVVLIWVYAVTSDRADRAAGLDESDATTAEGGEAH